MKVTFDVPVIDDDTLKPFGITRQDLVDDVGKVAKLFVLMRQVQLKDAVAKELSGDTILPERVRTVFAEFEEHLAKVSMVTGVEAKRQYRIRQKERDRQDGVVSILTQHEQKKRKPG